MSRRRKAAVAILSVIAFGAACEVAYAQPKEPVSGDAASAPAYTLEVDSDAPDVVSFEAIAARVGSELGGSVVRPGTIAASRAAISIRYRDRELTVRAIHSGGRVLERSVKAEGDDAAVQREAVLLAGNLARDEAREILDALAARPAPPGPKAPEVIPPEVQPAKPAVDEGFHPVSVALFSPIATNFARPNVTSNLNLSFVYGRVGTVDGVQLGSGFVYASRAVSGVQLGAAATTVSGPMSGAQLGGVGNLATGAGEGAQLGGAANIALQGFDGAQLSGALNLTRGSFDGLQIAGAANIATRHVEGAQLSGGVNVADTIDGAQVGVINVAGKVRGAQVGVINIAEEVDGAAVGLISISKGGIHPIAWTSNLQYMNAGVKFSTKYLYTIAAVHYGTLEGEFGNIGTTAVIGGRVPLPLGFDVEVQSAFTYLVPRPSQSTKDGNNWVAPQLIGGYSLAPHLRVFAGGGARLPISVDLGRDVVRPEVLAGVQF